MVTDANPARPTAASFEMASRGGEESPPPQIDVDPGEVEVFGSVEVTFALED